MSPKLTKNAWNKQRANLHKKLVNEQKLWRESARKLKWNWENPKPLAGKVGGRKTRRANLKVQNAFNQRITPRLSGNAKKGFGYGFDRGIGGTRSNGAGNGNIEEQKKGTKRSR